MGVFCYCAVSIIVKVKFVTRQSMHMFSISNTYLFFLGHKRLDCPYYAKQQHHGVGRNLFLLQRKKCLFWVLFEQSLRVLKKEEKNDCAITSAINQLQCAFTHRTGRGRWKN